MSNANRIHLLSLAAATLGHLAKELHVREADAALTAVLKDITALTESGSEVVVKATDAQVEDLGVKLGTALNGLNAQAEPAEPVCGCGSPQCTLVDVLKGIRTDWTVKDLIQSFLKDFGTKDTAVIVIESLNFLQEQIASDEWKPTPANLHLLAELAEEGVKLAAQSQNVQVKVVDGPEAFEALLNDIFGKKPGEGETRH